MLSQGAMGGGRPIGGRHRYGAHGYVQRVRFQSGVESAVAGQYSGERRIAASTAVSAASSANIVKTTSRSAAAALGLAASIAPASTNRRALSGLRFQIA